MLQSFLLNFTSIFVALDIIGAVPVYFTITRQIDLESRRRIVNVSMVVAFGVAIVFMVIGQSVFRHLGISIYDFKIAGGVVLLLIALADLLGGPESVQKSSGSTGVVPLAVPLITGPAVLTAIILQVGNHGFGITLISLVLNYLIAWVILRKCDLIQKAIGKDGTVVISKIAALLLAAISVSMVRSGVFEAILDFHAH